MTTDLHDTRLALRTTLDIVERILITDKKKYGLPDVKKMLGDIEMARALLEEEIFE